MWTYEIKTGKLYSDKDELVGIGYSGNPTFKNDPSAVAIKDEGPLPEGVYTVLSPEDTKTHGPYVLWLEPDPTNEMFDRSGFGIHGDSVISPGTASEGCIVIARGVREMIWDSGDHNLTVISEGALNEGNSALNS